VVLASAPEPGEPAEAATGMAGIVTLSANGLDGVRRAAARFADDLADRPDEQFAQLCWTSNRVKASGQHRLAVVAGDREQAISRLRTAAADDAALAAVTGLARPMSAGWLFTGQGSQYPGMFRPLYEASTAFRRELDAVDELLAAPLGASIRELMFADGEAIHGTGLAQPAIFAAEYATARVLADAGVAPSWLIGHSVGEYAAAAFAGVLDIADACALIVLRGRLMQQLPAGGSMLAVALDEAAASEAIAQLPQVSIAAVNGPRDVVVSGDGDALRRLQETLSTQGVTARPLTVSHAFHSPLMQPMVAAFAEAAAAVEFRPAQLPFYSTVRGRLLGVDEVIGADYWVEQITAPVRFAAAAAEALQADPTHVVEIGPRPILSPMLARIAPDATATRIAVCPGPSATGDELLEVVAALYRAGLDPRWDALYEPQARVRRRVSGYDFDTTQRFWVTAAGPEASARVPAVAGASAALPSPAPTHHSEDSTMDDLIALFREQNAIVASYLGDGQRPAMTAVPSAAARAVELVAAPPAATPAAPAVTAAQIAAAVRAEAARVSGFSPERLLDTQTLSGDLGLDSIMIADLATGLGRTLAGISVEPGSILADGTLGDLIERLAEQVMSAPAPAAAPPAAPPPPAPAPELPRARRTGVVAEDRIEEFPEVVEIAERLAGVRALGLENPYFLVNDGIAQDTSIIDGVEVINFSSFNYLGMSGHPAVVAATQEAVGRYGTSVSSSRLLSGEKPIHQSLEAELAALLGTDDSIALTSGHATNVTVIGHVISPDDLVIHDALAHNSIVEGAVLSGATRRPFPHNDAAALDEILTATRQQYRRALIVIEGIYSQDGDIADLPAIIAVKKKHGALLMIDEAHSLGVLGATGAGVGEHFGVDRADVELWSGTLSKSLASCGGYVASSHATIQFLKYTTPGFIFSTGMSPANAAAALAALRQMQAEPEVLAVLAKNSELFLQLAKEAGIDTGISAGTPVVPCILGDSLKTLTLSRALLARGINVNPILYPAVPEHLARLRFFLTASHTEDQIRYTVATLVSEIAAAS
jgi:8-amino-7-oxononanoate synthase